MTPHLLALLALSAPLALPAQDPEGEPAFVRIRFVGEQDGLPQPGVVLYQNGESSAALVAESGFLVAESEAVTRLRRAQRSWRSDPAGEVVLPRDALQRHGLFTAEPFSLAAAGTEDGGVLVWKVQQREPVGVRALDGNGRPLAHFPVALHTGGQDVSVALTDGEGRAVLGMPPNHTARIWISPAGWIGPRDAMPTIAAGRDGRRGTDLRVPPHGRVRLRALRGGQPVRVRLDSVAVRLVDDPAWQSTMYVKGEVTGLGFELPFVALGAAITGNVAFAQEGCSFRGNGPSRTGECSTIDVEVPWHPRVTFALAGPPAWALPGPLPTATASHALVRLVTDAGTREAFAHRDAGGRWALTSEPALRGSRLERVEFDLFVAAAGDAPPRHWIACVRPATALATPVLDLGTVQLAPGPTLHGRVVDANDQPLADVDVIVKPPNGQGGHRLRSDADGRFVWQQALPRDDDGNPVRLNATARTATLQSATVEADAEGAAIVLRLVEPTPPPRPGLPARRAIGTLVATVVGTKDQDQGRRWTLFSDDGTAAGAVVTRNHDGTLEVAFQKLPRGRYSLVVEDREFQHRIVCTGLEVPEGGPCSDPRLTQLSLREAPRVLHVRAADRQGVPLAGVRVAILGAATTTDGNGMIRVATHDPAPVRGLFEGTGLRPHEVPELTDGMTVVMSPASTFCVRLAGLPDGLPRDQLEVWVRDERGRFLATQADVAADGAVVLPTPHNGRYLVHLLRKDSGGKNPNQRMLVAARPEPIDIGDDDVGTIEWQLDDVARTKLRERAR